MPTVTILEASPIDPATLAPVPVRLAGGGVGPYLYKGFEDWSAGLSPAPLFQAALGYDKNGWTGGAIPTTGAITFSPATGDALAKASRLYWNGQTVTISTADDSVSPLAFSVVLVGKIAAQSVDAGVLSLAVSDLSGDLVKPLAPDRFLGTGGIEGDTGVEGRTKRRSLGRVFNVEGRVLIAADNIYEFGDPARPLQQFDALRDKGRAADAEDVSVVAWQGSMAATLTALRAATAAPGGGVEAPSIACVKWWTQPSGPLTADIRGEIGAGYVETAPELAARIVTTSSTLTVANTSEAAGLRAGIAGIHIDDNSETAASAIDRLLLGVSLLWLVEPSGGVRFREWSFASGGLSARDWSSDGGASVGWTAAGGAAVPWGLPAGYVAAIRSEQVTRQSVLNPVKSRRLGYQRNYRQHTDGEISAAILANDVLYPDGIPVAALQPAQAGSDVTALSQVVVDVTRSTPLNADYQGNVDPAMFPVQTSAKVSRGGIDIRTAATTTYAIATANVTATIDNTAGSATKGTISITALFANSGYVDLTVTVAGIAQPTIRITVSKSVAATPSTGSPTSKSAVDTSFLSISTASYSPISDVLQVAVAAGERLVGTAPLDYYVQDSGGSNKVAVNRTASAKWQYATSAGGPWTDFGAPIQGSAARSSANDGSGEYVDPIPGHGDFNQAVSALAAGVYFAQLVAAASATGRTITFEGSATLEAKT